MRINKLVAQASGLSRRAADQAIERGEVSVNGKTVKLGQEVSETDRVFLNGRQLQATSYRLIMLNKPVGYVVSRNGQGSHTVYDLLPPEFQNLKPIGRLDKDSSGLLLLTNDGNLAQALTHPKFAKEKVYEVELNKPLKQKDFEAVTKSGVDIGDNSLSRFKLKARSKHHESSRNSHDSYFMIHNSAWLATLVEGRNRQIRRTFAALGYTVTKLHRVCFGDYILGGLKSGEFEEA